MTTTPAGNYRTVAGPIAGVGMEQLIINFTAVKMLILEIRKGCLIKNLSGINVTMVIRVVINKDTPRVRWQMTVLAVRFWKYL